MIKKPLIIAVDGPSSSGKGTLAEKIAKYFNLAYLNSGALFRAVAMQIIESQIELEKLNIHLEKLVNNLHNYNLENPQLFSEEVGVIASQIAKNQTLRDYLLKFQRDFISINQQPNCKYNGAIIDGRDIASIVYPQADIKFFIIADLEIRAKRRFAQLVKNNPNLEYQTIFKQLESRDSNDINRINAPLIKVADAIIIDNGTQTIDQSFDEMSKIITKFNNQK